MGATARLTFRLVGYELRQMPPSKTASNSGTGIPGWRRTPPQSKAFGRSVTSPPAPYHRIPAPLASSNMAISHAQFSRIPW
jgi:hypothetical protein